VKPRQPSDWQAKKQVGVIGAKSGRRVLEDERKRPALLIIPTRGDFCCPKSSTGQPVCLSPLDERFFVSSKHNQRPP
jgi:hypothetical protein